MVGYRLHAERLGELFRALDAGLSGSGIRAPVEIVVVGGAAVALQWDQARTTLDVDVVAEGIPLAFWRVVETVGRDEGLEDGWLNAAARITAPTGPTPGEPTEVYRGPNLRVYGASPHYVLAMKLLSGRGTDREDMPVLMEAAKLRSKDELYDLVERAYPMAQIPVSAGYIIDQVWADYTGARPERVWSAAGPVGVHVRPYQHDNHGWEVVATAEPDGLPSKVSGPHPTLEEAERARDFVVRLVNVHPQLHILGSDPQTAAVVGSCPPPAPNAVPAVGVYSPEEDGTWYVQCRNADGTEDATSPPYPTYQAASDALDQLRLLSMTTSDREIGHRATVEPTPTSCRCSMAGWRCGHNEVEPPEAVPPARDRGLSL